MVTLEELQQEIVKAREETLNLAKEKDKQIQQLTEQLLKVQDELNHTKADLQTKIDLAQNTANDGVAKANAAQNTANDGVAKANAAQNTANDGVAKANAAQNTANDGVAKANAAQNTVNSVIQRISKVETKVKYISLSRSGTGTVIKAGPNHMKFQSDGNIVIYGPSIDPIGLV